MTAAVVALGAAGAGRPRCCDCGVRLRADERPAARCTACVGRVLQAMLRFGITPRVDVLDVAGDALATIAQVRSPAPAEYRTLGDEVGDVMDRLRRGLPGDPDYLGPVR